jgi:hypothetical protein
MTKLLFAAVTTLVLIQDAKPTRNPWAGFSNGSWAVIETTKTLDGKMSTDKQRYTVRVEADGIVTHLVSKEEDKPAIFFEERKHIPGADPSVIGGVASNPKGVELKIGDRTIACELTEFEIKGGSDDGEIRTSLWRTKDVRLPYRELKTGGRDIAVDPDVLRVEVTIKSGKMIDRFQFAIVQLNANLKVGGADVTCSVEEGTFEETDGTTVTKGTVRRWLSDSVPGRIVKSETRAERGDKKLERTEQVISFKVMK